MERVIKHAYSWDDKSYKEFQEYDVDDRVRLVYVGNDLYMSHRLSNMRPKFDDLREKT